VKENVMSCDNTLLDLARKMRHIARNDSRPFREVLEASLLPLIRCALRSGLGNPSLVRWVRRQAPGQTDPARAAPPLARILCDRLMERIDPLPARETVVGT
jgi:hypothetical protein